MTNARLDGLILVGGKSSRMKTPKALLSLSGIPQWQACENSLGPVCHDIFFSVASCSSFTLPVASSRLIKDVFVEAFGPIAGIISAFHQQKDHALFVLACDMPHMDEEATQFLAAQRDSSLSATVFVNEDGLIEPLCGIYEPRIFPDLIYAWAHQELCPRKLLSRLPIKKVVPRDFSWLKNVNTPHDLPAREKFKKISLMFYAGLKEHMQCGDLEITTKAETVGDVYRELAQRYNFYHDQNTMRFAKNHHLVDEKSLVSDGDEIVFIPPVSGG